MASNVSASLAASIGGVQIQRIRPCTLAYGRTVSATILSVVCVGSGMLAAYCADWQACQPEALAANEFFPASCCVHCVVVIASLQVLNRVCSSAQLAQRIQQQAKAARLQLSCRGL